MWFYLALIATIISPLVVILNKRVLNKVDPTVLIWSTTFLSLPVVVFLALKDGIPQIESTILFGLIGSVTCYLACKTIFYRVIKSSKVSDVFPLTSVGPIITLLISILPPLNERPSIFSVFGVIVIIAGLYTLHIDTSAKGFFAPIKVIFKSKLALMMLLSVVIDSVIIIFDKIAITSTVPSSPLFILLIENLSVVLILLPVLIFTKRDFVSQISTNIKILLPIALISSVVWFFGMSAVAEGNVAIVSAIFKTQLLLVLLYSAVFNREKIKFWTVVGSIIMIIGVILIKLVS